MGKKQYLVESDYKNPDLYIARLKGWNLELVNSHNRLYRSVKELTQLNNGQLPGLPTDLLEESSDAK